MIRTALRLLLAAFYLLAGVIHIAHPAPFLTIMPSWVPHPDAVVFWTGLAELAGAAALAQPFSASLRRMGGLGLALYAICVFPANINHFIMDMAKPGRGFGLGYHLPRMVAQPLLVWLALWTGGVIAWPFKRRRKLD